MKKLIFLPVIAIAGATMAGNLTLSNLTLSGGGGQGTGGRFQINTTVGQPGGASLSGGNFSMKTSYWSLPVALQTPGAPVLTLKPVANGYSLSWPVAPRSFNLEMNHDLTKTNGWSLVAQAPATNNGIVSLTVPADAGKNFFRLHAAPAVRLSIPK